MPSVRVKRVSTVSSEGQVVSAIKQAWPEVFGGKPTLRQVGKTWAQIATENQGGKGIFNYNVGNLNWTPQWRGDWYETQDSQTVGNNPANRLWLPYKRRAYNSLEEGVADYLKLLKNNGAAKALNGTVKDFSYALAKAHYYDPYTRDDYVDKSGKKVSGYTSALLANYNNFISKHKNGVPTEQASEPNMLVSFFKRLGDILDSLTREAGSIKMNSINKYGSNYPQNKYLISVDSSSDLSSKLEFARILSLALKEEIDANTEIYTDGKDVEVQCVVNVERTRGLHILSELCNSLSETFEYATKKIGGVKTNTFVMPNEDSCYQKLDIKLSETNYRKFQLKFIK